MVKKIAVSLVAVAFLTLGCKEEGSFEKMGKKADKAVEDTQKAAKKVGEDVEDSMK